MIILLPIKNSRNYIDNQGNVWRDRKGKLIKCRPTLTPEGYFRVWINNKAQFVHRLLATVFYGEPQEGNQARHLDSNPTNNRLGNVKWGTRKENEEDKIANGTHSSQIKKSKYSDELIKEIAKSILPISILSEKYGIRRKHIYMMKNPNHYKYLPREINKSIDARCNGGGRGQI
jgi:hypothetical protein